MAERRELTESQRRAATPGRSSAVVAGAGSGKTAVLVERYLATLRSGVAPAEACVVTFTRAAAAEVRHRAVSTLRAEAAEHPGSTAETLADAVRRSPFLGTLHGVAFELLRRWGAAADLPALERIASEAEVAERLRVSADTALAGAPTADAELLADAFTPSDWRSLAKLAIEHRMTVERSFEADRERNDVRGATARTLLALFREWDRALSASGAYGYGDLERLAVALAESDGPTGEALRRQFRVALVDEFQDTNGPQWRLVKALLRWDTSGRGELFVVGDPRQSIYRFRGARPELFTAVAAEVVEGGGELVTLATNFRSRPALVATTNALLEPLFGRGTLEATPTEAGREDDGQRAVEALTYDGGDKRAEQRHAEAEVVSAFVPRLLESVSAQQIAILLRSSEPIALFADALRHRGIPVAAQRTVSVFATDEAQAVLALFRAVADPLDDYSVAAFLRSAWARVGAGELDAWRRLAGKRSLFEALLERGGGPRALQVLADLVERGTTDAESCYRAMTAATGGLVPSDALLRVLDTGALAGDVRTAVRSLERWSAEGAVVQERPEGPGVRILTVHGSKGLEFDWVFLADLYRTAPRLQPPLLADEGLGTYGLRYRDEGGNPVEEPEYESLKERDLAAGQAESKRLLYVALTRARERLVLVRPSGTVKMPKESWAAWLQSI